MKTLTLLLFIALFATGCGHAQTVQIDPAVQPYVDRFVAASSTIYDSPVQIDDLIIVIADTLPVTGDSTGVCQTGFGITPTITLLKSYWESMDPELSPNGDIGREALVFHELGHCVLARPHRNDTFYLVIPATADSLQSHTEYQESIMYYQADELLVDVDYYTQNREKYMSELFSGWEPNQ